jgi:hypothetical protein
MQMQFNESATVLMPPETCSSKHEAHSALAAGPKIYTICAMPIPISTTTSKCLHEYREHDTESGNRDQSSVL